MPKELNPTRSAHIHESLAKQGLMRHFGTQIEALKWGEITLSMPLSAGVTQQHGFFHGGTVGALADTACGYAALSVVQDGEAGLTAEYKLNLLSPADGERLIAVGRVLKPGRTLIVCQGDVFVEKNGARKQCGTMLMTLCVVKTLGHL